jgi:hypothetical protein
MIAVRMTLGISMRCLSARWGDASLLHVLYVRQELAHPEVNHPALCDRSTAACKSLGAFL